MVEAGIPAIEITGGGEPFLHPKITEFIRLCGEAKRDIGIVTNGSLLNDERIELIKQYATWIRISMDSSNPDTHKIIHGTPGSDFERILNNIKKLLENKRDDLILGISFIITPENLIWLTFRLAYNLAEFSTSSRFSGVIINDMPKIRSSLLFSNSFLILFNILSKSLPGVP